MKASSTAALVLSALGMAFAQNNSSDISFAQDPYLAWQPEFARSLPVQILLTGIMLTLCCILALNLLFTYTYHFPLSKLNYGLQLAGVFTLLLAFITSFHVILSQASQRSKEWPYMLDYVAIEIPPDGWSSIGVAWWFGLLALASGLVHVTHIQFLTILFPSSLECKLILTLLGPLALLSALTELIPIHATSVTDDSDTSLQEISDSIQNIANSTLLLLYTIALAVWGFLVSRQSAWRTDGGTAAFGGAAMLLACVSTVLGFLRTTDQGPYVWLPGLVHTVVLWQNFAGWWWWVGAGNGEPVRKRDKKRAKKRDKAARETSKNDNAWGWLQPRWAKRKPPPPRNGSAVTTVIIESDSPTTDTVNNNNPYGITDTPALETDALSVHTTSTLESPTQVNSSSAISTTTHQHHPPRSQLHEWFSSCWQTLRRAHLMAVRRQALERVAISRGETEVAEVVEMDDLDKEKKRRKDEAVESSVKGGMLWWGPFGKWRLKDRTVY